jgi:hypothetical protein
MASSKVKKIGRFFGRVDGTNCCGVDEIDGLENNTPEEIVYGSYNANKGNCAYYTFTDVEDGNGDGVAKYIRANKLGTITRAPIALNPNSGNRIKIWIWTVDHAAMEKFCKTRATN